MTDTLAPLRVAMVGTGNIARLHAEALQALGEAVDIVAAVDVDAGRLEQFCGQYGDVDGYTNLADMLDAAKPDAVHVCTPPGLHREQVHACLGAGVSALVEKPPTLSLRDMDALIAAEGDHGPWVATVFQHRFGSGARRLRAMMSSGVLGRPLLAVCHTTWFRDQAYFELPWRGAWATEGGGPTMGHGIHQMDLLASLLGDWTEVSALARQQARSMETEDLSLAHVTFASGAVATVVNSVLSPREETYLRFDFEHATVELTHLYGYGDANWRITPAPGFEESVMRAWNAGEWGTSSGHLAQLAAVTGNLRAGLRPDVTSAEARRTLQLVAATYASAFRGHPVGPGDVATDSPFYERMEGDGPSW